MDDFTLEEALKVEAIRILLKHPYGRRPDQCSLKAISIGSNITVSDNYDFHHFKIDEPRDYYLEKGKTYEWYCHHIQFLDCDGTGNNRDSSDILGENRDVEIDKTSSRVSSQISSSCNLKEGNDVISENAGYIELSELWDEDDMACEKINSAIEGIKDWGSISGKLSEIIKANTAAKVNWHNILAGFRASILTSKRRLTRMRPNRRFGFDQMGSVRKFDTKLLIAIDVSASISSENLSYFFGIVDSAFRYGFETIDVIQFDYGISDVCSFGKAKKTFTIIGRGGTSFNGPIKFAHKNEYDGLMILTDGYAPLPDIPDGFRTKIIWVCENEDAYSKNHEWMEKVGRVCMIDLS